MSITHIRTRFAACGIVMAVVFMVILVVGLLWNPVGCPQAGADLERLLGEVVVTVDGEPVYEGQVTTLARILEEQQVQSKRASRMPPDLSPFESLDARIGALQVGIQQALVFGMAKRRGIDVDEANLEDWAVKGAEKRVQEMREYVESMYATQTAALEGEVDRLKKEKGPDATETKEAEKRLAEHRAQTKDQYLESIMGRSPKQVVEDAKAEVEKGRTDPLALRELLARMVADELVETYFKSLKLNDELLKKSFDKFTFQQLLITLQENTDPVSKANEVLKKIREGMDFKEAVKQFSNAPRAEDQKPEDVGTQTLDRFAIEIAGTFTQILDLKPGEISEVIELPQGAAIYRMEKVEPVDDAAFQAEKKRRLKEYEGQYAQNKIRQELEKRRKAAKYEWKNPIYRVLYEYDKLKNGEAGRRLAGSANQMKRVDAYRKIMQEADATNSPDSRLVALIKFACFSQIDADTPPGPEKDKLQEERLSVYEAVSSGTGGTAFMLEYANVLLAARQGEAALQQLLNAVSAAFDITDQNRAVIQQVEALLPKAANYAQKDSPLIQQIQEEIKRWRENEIEQKRLDEEEKKRLAEEEKAAKAAEEAAKAKVGQPQPQPGGSAPAQPPGGDSQSKAGG